MREPSAILWRDRLWCPSSSSSSSFQGFVSSDLVLNFHLLIIGSYYREFRGATSSAPTPVSKPHLHAQEPTICGGMAPLPQPSFQAGASLGPGQFAVPGDSAQRMCPAPKGTVLFEVFDVGEAILCFWTLVDLPVKWNYTSL